MSGASREIAMDRGDKMDAGAPNKKSEEHVRIRASNHRSKMVQL